MDNIKRSGKIDILRSLGILLIILAHCEAPRVINDVRCFDVILLVFISAYVGSVIPYENGSIIERTKARAKRLLVPTYLFIVLFSVVLFFSYRIIGKSELFGFRQIINSLLLCEDSVGYVWIIKVYFINAIILPFVFKFIKKIKHIAIYIVLLLIEFAVYYSIVYLYSIFLSSSYIMWIICNEWIITCFAYYFIAQEAVMHKTNKIWNKYGLYFWVLILLISMFLGNDGVSFSPSLGKRPPNIQYLSWGLVVTLALIRIIPETTCALTKWMSKNSLTVYLIHPVIILGFLVIRRFIPFIECFWVIEWVATVLFACILTYVLLSLSKRLKASIKQPSS